MREVKGDWRDLLSVYSIALDCKKIYLGLIAVLLTIAVMTISCLVYYLVDGPNPGVKSLGAWNSLSFLPMWVVCGQCVGMLKQFVPLLNPLGGNYVHFCVSVFFYIFWLFCMARCCGPITRLAALEYARDDIPSLGEARALCQKKWRAYFFAPMAPLLAVAFLIALNLVAGLIARWPYVGGWLLLAGYFAIIPFAVLVVFLLVFGIISFGLMWPAISVDGRDAFDGWSRAYSYLLWGVNRFVCYTALAGVLGVLAVGVACGLGESVIYATTKTVRFGMGRDLKWVEYHIRYKDRDGLLQAVGAIPTKAITQDQMLRQRSTGMETRPGSREPVLVRDAIYYHDPVRAGLWRVLKVGDSAPVVRGPVLLPGLHGEQRTGVVFSGWVAYILLLGVRGLVAGFALAYFFSAFTVIYFLMRKHVDRVDVTDIYVEEEPEGGAAQAAPTVPEGEAEGEAEAEEAKPTEEKPAEEPAPAPSAAKKPRRRAKKAKKKRASKKKPASE